jgi:hypothetical protein
MDHLKADSIFSYFMCLNEGRSTFGILRNNRNSIAMNFELVIRVASVSTFQPDHDNAHSHVVRIICTNSAYEFTASLANIRKNLGRHDTANLPRKFDIQVSFLEARVYFKH